MHLQAIPPIEPPEINKKNVKITINFIFDHFPSDYWLHYSKKEKRLIFEFMGSHISDSLPAIIGTEIVSDLQVRNSVSEYALNRKIARLSMKLNGNWHYEAWNIGRKIIRLQLFTTLNPAMKLDKKENKNFFPFLYYIEGAILSILLIILISSKVN